MSGTGAAEPEQPIFINLHANSGVLALSTIVQDAIDVNNTELLWAVKQLLA